ncbi:MAG: YraN family protein [Prevotellaceae bacterium]|jgi:putative endonuclease|nr:YraN family protein [Prevotellaceae bacterium]
MTQHIELGKQGEEYAGQYLISNGYRIIETNWRVGKLEIDIIAQKYDFLSFVEVKTRSTNHFGYPEEAITRAKMINLLKAAEKYIEKSGLDIGFRFEVIALTKTSDNTFELEHFDEAFDSNTVHGAAYVRW